MLKVVIALCLLIIPFFNSAQKIQDSEMKQLEIEFQKHLSAKKMDSVLHVIHLQDRRARKLNKPFYHVLIAINYAEYYFRKGVKDSVRYYVDAAERINKELKPSTQLLHIKRLALNYNQLYENSVKNDSLVLAVYKLAQSIGDEDYIYLSYIDLSRSYASQAKYDKALPYLYKAEKLWSQASDEVKTKRPPPYDLFGYIYYKKGEFEKIIEPLEKLIAFYVEIEDYWKAAQQSNNVASSYLRSRDDTTTFISTLHKSIEYARKADFRYGVANACNQLASFYVDHDQLDSAHIYMKMLDEAVPVIEEMDFKALVSVLWARYYRATGNLSKSELQYKQALEIWEESGDLNKQKSMTDILFEMNEESGDIQEAYKYLKKSYDLQKKLVDKDQIERVKEVELSQEFHKQQLTDSLKNQSILQQVDFDNKKKLREKEVARNYLLFGGAFIVLIAAVVLLAYRKKRRESILLNEKNTLIEKTLQEKQLLLKEIHHRVKNNFQMVSSLLRLQARNIEDEDAMKLTIESQNRIKSMAIIHQKLYQNDDLIIYFLEYIEKLVDEIENTYGSTPVSFDYNIDKNVTFDIDTAIPLALILNELITNSFKYGVDDSTGEGKLSIGLEKDIDGYRLIVKDTGAGIPETINWEKANSLGLRLVRRLAMQLHGKAEYSYNNGAEFTIFFKDTPMRLEVD